MTLLNNDSMENVTELVFQQSQGTKLLSGMINLAKHRNSFVLVTKESSFYKLGKLIYHKSTTEQNEEMQEKMIVRATRLINKQMK